MNDKIPEKDKIKINEYMDAKGVDKKCFMCKNGDFELFDRYQAVAGYHKRKDICPTIIFSCDNCSYILQFRKYCVIGV